MLPKYFVYSARGGFLTSTGTWSTDHKIAMSLSRAEAIAMCRRMKSNTTFMTVPVSSDDLAEINA